MFVYFRDQLSNLILINLQQITNVEICSLNEVCSTYVYPKYYERIPKDPAIRLTLTNNKTYVVQTRLADFMKIQAKMHLIDVIGSTHEQETIEKNLDIRIIR